MESGAWGVGVVAVCLCAMLRRWGGNAQNNLGQNGLEPLLLIEAHFF